MPETPLITANPLLTAAAFLIAAACVVAVRRIPPGGALDWPIVVLAVRTVHGLAYHRAGGRHAIRDAPKPVGRALAVISDPNATIPDGGPFAARTA